MPISIMSLVKNLILHPSDWSVCTEPDTDRCRYARHQISSTLVSVAKEKIMTLNTKLPNDSNPTKKKKPKDQSGVITPKDIIPQVVLNMPSESRSSVDIKQTAKGDSQVEIKVYAGITLEEVEKLADIAVRTYKRTCRRLQSEKDSKDA